MKHIEVTLSFNIEELDWEGGMKDLVVEGIREMEDDYELEEESIKDLRIEYTVK